MDQLGGFKLQTLRKLENLTLENGGRCWWCGEALKECSIWSDDNRHGMELEGYQMNQIVFFHCDSCGRNTSIQNVVPPHRYLLQLQFKGLAN